MPAERLFLNDSLLASFDARVLRVDDDAVILDRTAFYPEGGGQLADRGTLAIAGELHAIADVTLDDDGEVRHRLTRAPDGAIVGAAARGELDVRWRRERMSQHTGQHLLSAAFLERFGAETVSSRLGAETSTLDLGVPTLSDADVARAEDDVAAIVLDDAPVRVLYPTEDELARLPLRRAPKVTRDIRLVAIGDFDLSPCGGTHCTRTAQIGAVRVVASERYKGGVRLTFVTGAHAFADYRAKDGVLRELAKSFTCGALDVPRAVAKLRSDLDARMHAHGNARGELVALLAARAHAEHPVDASGTTRIAIVRPGDDLTALRALAGALARRPDVVAIVASPDEAGDLAVVVERGAAASFDAGAWLKKTATAHGGRGGGRPERAEGKLPPHVDLGAAH